MRCGAVILILLALSACKVREVAVQGSQKRTEVSRVNQTDSTTHVYQIEVVRVYEPNLGRLEREELRQAGEIREVITYVRDTIYIERADTLQEFKGGSAPIHPSAVELERVKAGRAWGVTTRWIIGAVAVIALVVLIWRGAKRIW